MLNEEKRKEYKQITWHKTRLLKEKMLDKVQTWHLPHLYSIRIQNYLHQGTK